MYRLIPILLLAGCFLQSAAHAITRSTSLYSEAEQSIYQIQVLNKKTGNKSTIGSGFLIDRGDILATNYHVVSDYVNDPGGFRLEYLSTSEETGSLELLGVDILHDLAVLRADTELGKPLKTDSVPEKGAELYSLGNPLDLGFSIVSGTNNGILSNSEDNNILFSGNLNPGMSGGPTLNEDGNVIGINVATAGNDVSFLVSAQYLDILLEKIKLRSYQPPDDLHGDITNQLSTNSIEMLDRLATNDWDMISIGQFYVPAEMGRSVSCWDSSSGPEERGLMTIYAAQCSNELQIYLNKKLTVGGMQFQYTWYEGDGMIAPRFYRNYESMNNSGLQVVSDQKSVTDFDCSTHFVDIDTKDFKMTICRRDYRRYLGLSDILVTGAMVSEKNRGLLFDLYMPGADFKSATRLLKRMLETFEWRR
ncbi:MAG: S1 family peptidase [Thiolinea sp.]